MLFSLIIGFKTMNHDITDYKVHYQLELLRQQKLIIKDINQIDISLYKYLYLRERKSQNEVLEDYEQYQKLQEEKKQKLNKFNKLNQLIKQEIHSIEFQMDYYYEKLKQKRSDLPEEDKEEQDLLEENKQNKLHEYKVNYIEEYHYEIDPKKSYQHAVNELCSIFQNRKVNQLEIPEEVKHHINEFIECEKIIRYQKEIHEDLKEDRKKQFREEYIKEHPIKSEIDEIVKEAVDDLFKQEEIKIDKEMNQFIISQLSQNDLSQTYIYQNYNESSQDYQAKFERQREILIQQNLKPSKTIILHRQLFPPYEVKAKQVNHEIVYSLVRQKKYEYQTSHYFWRIGLGFLRWFVWTFNCTFYFFVWAIVGPIGLRALCGTEPFHPDVQCDSKTGQVSPGYDSYQTVFSQFIRVLRGMRESRQNFEDQPDTGFFGKNCARICNLIEVYIFRFLIGGIIITLILFPIVIILNSIISLFLAITAWLWIIIVLILVFLFEFFLYDYDCPDEHHHYWRTIPFVPFFYEIYRFVWCGIFQSIFALICILILHPLFALFMLVFAHVRIALRSIYDWILFQCIKCCARVPASENNIAWIISGPGVSRQYYSSIEFEDIFVLIYAQLEKTELSEYQSILQTKMNEPQNNANHIITKYFKLFNAQRSYNDPSIPLMNKELTRQIDQRMKIYPQHPPGSVRFTSNELSYLLRKTKQFIKQIVERRDMTGYIWRQLGIEQHNYTKLTEKIWRQIFINSSDIFEPLEDIDMRFSLKRNQGGMINFDLITQALQGEVRLEKLEPKVHQKENGKREVVPEFISLEDITFYDRF